MAPGCKQENLSAHDLCISIDHSEEEETSEPESDGRRSSISSGGVLGIMKAPKKKIGC